MINLILKSLRFYWRQNLTIFVGTIFSTAVLTGALIVGDSVKLSLQKLVDVRLGKARFALQTGDRYVSAGLAGKISQVLGADAVPILILKGIAVNPESDSRVNGVQIVGIDSSFWQLSFSNPINIDEDEVIISSNLADRLKLKIGDEVLVRVENRSPVPSNSPFIQDNSPSIAFRFIIRQIANDNQMARFSLKSNQVAPFNIFISINALAKRLGLDGKANSILVSVADDQSVNQSRLDSALAHSWGFSDAGIKIRHFSKSNIYELISERIFIDQPLVEVLERQNIEYQPVLTYLSNSIESAQAATPYSFVSAMQPQINGLDIDEKEIVVNQWLAKDLDVRVGDTISLKYFTVGPLRQLVELNADFKVAGVIPIKTEEIDESLMPLFPGFADAGSCRDWSADIPIDWKKIRNKDELYWNEYKGTPKAIISIKDGLRLWQNQYGHFTSIRFDANKVSIDRLEDKIMKSLNPSSLGIYFYPVYKMGAEAATNSVDFGELFLSLSFFVIIAGVLLIVLLYSLNIELRKEEVGLFASVGFDKSTITRTKIYESSLIAFTGAVVGAFLGVIYNKLVLLGLNSLWIDAVRTSSLEVFVKPSTIITGALVGFILAILSIYLVVRRQLSQSLIQLISKGSALSGIKRHKNYLLFIGILLLIIALALTIVSLLAGKDMNAGLFLTAGGVFMLGSILIVSRLFFIYSDHPYRVGKGIVMFALRNSSRFWNRSIAVISLLALGTFTIIITGANRKTFYGVEDDNSSGTGGYAYWAENSLPLIYDLNSKDGQMKIGLPDELRNVHFAQFYSLDGDDASCLNLNLVQQPRILAVNPLEFNKRNSFSFASVLKGLNKEQPWLNLQKSYGDYVIPAVVDQTVLTWGLKKKVGDTLFYLNEKGERIGLLLVGGLNNSIFQGNLLVSDSEFARNFPSSNGSKVMLIDSIDNIEGNPEEMLSSFFADYGLEISSTNQRLAEFNSVTNTYLSVFMILGGLGVIIGTIGLGIVLLRNIIERRTEIALLLAVGFSRSKIIKLIMIENIYLLVVGVIIGIISALIGILPSLISPAFDMPSRFMFILVLIVLVFGTISIYLPAHRAIKGNIISGLREE